MKRKTPKRGEQGKWRIGLKTRVKIVFGVILAIGFGASSVVNYYEGGKLVKEVFGGTSMVSQAQAKSFEKEVDLAPAKDCNEAIDRTDGPADLMKRIVKSESTNNPKVKNPVSSASGCFQWISSSWNQYGKEFWGEDFFGKNIYNPQDNTDLAAYVIGKYGTNDWNASRDKWSK
ncbi:MAG: transglycosylase SLT domain-containing protein [Candidatus Moraniibacteriota bacterium]